MNWHYTYWHENVSKTERLTVPFDTILEDFTEHEAIRKKLKVFVLLVNDVYFIFFCKILHVHYRINGIPFEIWAYSSVKKHYLIKIKSDYMHMNLAHKF